MTVNLIISLIMVMVGVVMLGVVCLATGGLYMYKINPNWEVVEVLILFGKILSIIGLLGMVTCVIILSSK